MASLAEYVCSFGFRFSAPTSALIFIIYVFFYKNDNHIRCEIGFAKKKRHIYASVAISTAAQNKRRFRFGNVVAFNLLWVE